MPHMHGPILQTCLPLPTPFISSRISSPLQPAILRALHIQRPILRIGAILLKAGKLVTTMTMIIIRISTSYEIEQVFLKGRCEDRVDALIGAVKKGVCEIIAVEGRGDVE